MPADSGYNARQVNEAAAKLPALRLEIVKRSDDSQGFVVLPRRWVSREPSRGSVAIVASPRTMRTSPTLLAFVVLASIQIAIRRLAR